MIIRTATADREGAHGTVASARFAQRPLMTSRRSEWCASKTGVNGTTRYLADLTLIICYLPKSD
jgi:hypothetical protein